MKAFDANCTPSAAAKAKELEWTVASPPRLELKSGNDLRLVKAGMSVSSMNGDWLRQACRKSILVDPLAVPKFEKDEGLVRAVADSDSVFELPMRPLLHSFGRRRAQRLSAYSKFYVLCQKRDAKIAFTSQAQSAFDVKSPREAVAIWQQMGVPRDRAASVMKQEVRFG
ncbi:hypothetical protein HYV43_01415 [Candidatus Micrarchaeota archaeon]|nr:hypothetical protein [Candidatus Micrarchaeota archaeon]